MSSRLKVAVIGGLLGMLAMFGAAPAMADGHAGLEASILAEVADRLDLAGVGGAAAAETLVDVPAMTITRDADGTVRIDGPALEVVHKPEPKKVKKVDPTRAPADPARQAPARLPVTGVNVGDFFALGMAALSGGGFLIRRLRFSLGA